MSFFETIKQPKKSSGQSEPWLTSYADLVTNLMAFFVMLLSMSTFETVKMNAVTKEFSRVRADSLDKLEKSLNAKITQKGLGKKASVKLTDAGLFLEFRGEKLFEPGSDMLTATAQIELKPVLETIAKIESKYLISLEGHTDDVPLIASRYFKDNWSLSSARGASFMREMSGLGVPLKRMNIAGFADTRPIQDPKPLLDSVSKAVGSVRELAEQKLRTARALNRRVVVRVYQ
jgi:chemotaxis protein MotB